MKAVVVALGKVGLPLAAQLASAGHEVTGCDIDPRVVDLVNRGLAPFPGEEGLEEALGEAVRGGRLRATPDTTAAVAEGPDLVVAVPPLYVDADAQPDWARPRRGRRRHRRGPAARARRRDRDDRPRRHDALPHRAGARGRSGPARGGGLLGRLQPRARVQRPRPARPRDLPEARRRAQRARRGARRRSLRRVPRRRRLADGLGGGGRAGEARRDDLPRPEHRLRQRARPPRRRARPRRRPRHRAVELAAVQPHPPPGRRGRRRTASPSTRASTSPATRPRGCPRPRARSTRRCPPTRSSCSRARSAASRAIACSSSASPTAAA